MMNVLDFGKLKGQRKISMVTSYDTWSAKLINETPLDCILVGDSLSMVMHGHDSTLKATVSQMAMHCEAVVRGAPDKFVVGDLPFLSYRKGLNAAMEAAHTLMQTGVHALKLEGVRGHEDIVRHMVESGIPIMGHLGLTPQSIHQLGGHRVQGRGDAAQSLLEDARTLQSLGCFSLVLECVPGDLAHKVTQDLAIPTIGIGAGNTTDGQVLVLQDLLGLNKGFRPKFLKTYLQGADLIQGALATYHNEVVEQAFPSQEESYS